MLAIKSKHNFTQKQKEFIESIISGLKWMGIKWDEEIIYQSQRISRHRDIALKLFSM